MRSIVHVVSCRAPLALGPPALHLACMREPGSLVVAAVVLRSTHVESESGILARAADRVPVTGAEACIAAGADDALALQAEPWQTTIVRCRRHDLADNSGPIVHRTIGERVSHYPSHWYCAPQYDLGIGFEMADVGIAALGHEVCSLACIFHQVSPMALRSTNRPQSMYLLHAVAAIGRQLGKSAIPQSLQQGGRTFWMITTAHVPRK